MKKLIGIFLSLLLFSCVKDIKSLTDLKSDFYELQNRSVRMNDTLRVNFGANQDKIISVELLINGKKLENNVVLDESNAELGLNQLEIYVETKDGRVYGKTKLPVLSQYEEKAVEFEVINEYPHSKELFTQGFFFHNDRIYEISGQYKKSKIVSYKLGSTGYLQETKLEDRFFAEGAEIVGDKIFVLTYRERSVLVYDSKSLELIETLNMPAELREGWGLTYTGSELIAGDGSQNLYFFDEKLNFKRQIQVVGNISIYNQINELEFINGKIYANVWQTPYILVINPDTGRVEQYYNLQSINESKGSDDVLNGIAFYNGNILVTGKNWSKIYELNLPEELKTDSIP